MCFDGFGVTDSYVAGCWTVVCSQVNRSTMTTRT